MKAILILIVAAALAFAWAKRVEKMSGEELMGCGIFVLIPWVVIAVGTVVALVMLT